MFLSANAQAESVKAEYFYKVYWSGFEVGDLLFKEEQTDLTYSSQVDIAARSIAAYFWKYSSSTKIYGIRENGKFVPQKYNSIWSRKKEKQDIELGFSKKGDVISESLVPPEKVEKRPIVSDEFRKSVFDPVTAAIVSRETIRKEMAKNPNSRAEFLIPIFDAKRRFDVGLTIQGYETIQFDGKQREFLRINIRRLPIAGYTENDLQEMADEQQNIDFYLNEDFIPVYGVAKAAVGRATIKLVSRSSEAISDYRP
jgi:hypothetical protein